MHPVEIRYLVHGEGGIPLWLLVCALVLLLWLTQRWNRREREGRRGRCPAFLPWTLTILFLLAATAFYNPVVVKSTTLEGDKRVIALVDDSRSMGLPLTLGGPSDRLDAAALWQGRPLSGRSTAAGDLARLIADLGSEAPAQRAAVQHLEAQREEGMPPGPGDRDLAEGYRRWRSEASASLGQALAALQRERADEETSTHSLEPVQALMDRFAVLPDSPDADDALRDTARRLDALIAAAGAAEQCARQIQVSADERWLNGPGKAAGDEVQAVAERTRGELARKLAEILPEGTAVVPCRSARTTRLATSIGKVLRQDHEIPISHLLLFSDGADQEGEEALGELRKLADEGIAFYAVGADLPAPEGPDAAILDWAPAPVVQAGTQATLRCKVRAARGTPTTLRLLLGETVLAQVRPASDAEPISSLSISYQAPEPGRHTLVLEISAEGDTVPGNNRATFVQDSAPRRPELMLVDDVPDWDSAYLELAARRAGIGLSQAHAAGKTPERGGFRSAVPKNLEQWSRYAGVLLRGTAFPGFENDDAATLHELVARKGRTLVVMSGQSDSWLQALAAAFGWRATSEAAGGELAVPADTCHLPAIAMASDPDDARLSFAALPGPHRARTVPQQDVVLIADERGRPVCSLGFHGRGKVILCGLDGLAPMRRSHGAAVIDRFCESLVAAAVTPLFLAGEQIAIYPSLPDRDRDTWLISLLDATEATIDGSARSLAPGRGNRTARWKPAGVEASVRVGPAQETAMTADNPGLELRFPAFRPDRLQALAAAGQGTYRPIRGVREALAGIEPQTWRTVQATVYRPGRHWLLFAGLLIVAALHWVLRKLAGLAI